MDVAVPNIGDFADVPVIEILVSPGDEVGADDPLVTLESDKATMDVPAPAAGTVTEVAVKVGDRVSEGSVILTLDAAGSVTAPAPAPPAASGATVTAAPPSSPERDADVVVIGSGPGGYTAAFRAADLGLRTILVERYETLGGVCLNVGCIPSKALLHAARTIAEAQEMADRGVEFGKPAVDLDALLGSGRDAVRTLTGGLAQLAHQRKVEVVTGSATLTGPHSLTVGGREITFDNCILAVGSRPVALPMLPDDPRVIDSTGALSPRSLPGRLLVIGGGIIGLEMATVYDALGSRVTVVEMQDQLIPGCDPDLVGPLHKRVSGRYEAILLSTQVLAAEAQRGGITVEFSSGDTETYDRVLVAVGRAPNGHGVGAQAAGVTVDARGFIAVDAQMRTNVPSIYAIGDVVGQPMLAHKATHEAVVAAEAIAGLPGVAFDPVAIPSVAYTDPEVAWAGLTEADAKRSGVEFERAKFPWIASGRALGFGRTEGLTKLLVSADGPGGRRVLGAGIVGVGAGDLIAEAVLAMEMGATAEDVALTVHPHPTLSETIAFSAEMAEGTITDLLPRTRR